MNMQVVVDCGLDACRGFLINSALCLGAGTDRETALKIGAIFAASEVASSAIPKFQQLLSIVATSIAYRQASLTLGSSLQVAKLGAVVKLGSLIFVQQLANRLIDGICSRDQREVSKQRAEALISGATLGVLARIAGCSNKVAVATFAIFGVSNLVISYANSRIYEIKKIPFTSLSGEQLNIPKWLIRFSISSAVSYATGRALRPLIAQ